MPPLNLFGDFGGGGLLLAMGILAALHERSVRAGPGRRCVDGRRRALLTAFVHGMHAAGSGRRGAGRTSSTAAAAFYDTYECVDGQHVAVGCVEPHFYAELLDVLGLTERTCRSSTTSTRRRAEDAPRRVFATRPRDEWARSSPTPTRCVSPVLSPWEAHEHPHNAERERSSRWAASVSPHRRRASAAPADTPAVPPHPGADTDRVLAAVGYDEDAIKALRVDGAVE